MAAVAAVALVAVCVYFVFYRKDKVKGGTPLVTLSQDLSAQAGPGMFIDYFGLMFCKIINEIIIKHDLIAKFFLYLGLTLGIASDKPLGSLGPAAGASTGLKGITVDKSVEFSHEELAKATDNFSMANKIGEGGFGSVYYAELRGEVCSPTPFHLLLNVLLKYFAFHTCEILYNNYLINSKTQHLAGIFQKGLSSLLFNEIIIFFDLSISAMH